MQSGKPMFSTIFPYSKLLKMWLYSKLKLWSSCGTPENSHLYCFWHTNNSRLLFPTGKKGCNDKKTWVLTFKTISSPHLPQGPHLSHVQLINVWRVCSDIDCEQSFFFLQLATRESERCLILTLGLICFCRVVRIYIKNIYITHNTIQWHRYLTLAGDNMLVRFLPRLSCLMGTSKNKRCNGSENTIKQTNRTMAMHVRYKSLYISLPFSAQPQPQMTQVCVFWRTKMTAANVSHFHLELNDGVTYLAWTGSETNSRIES